MSAKFRLQGQHTYRDTVPVLVYHHDAEEHAKCEEEQAVDVMLDRVTYRNAEREQEDLPDGVEGDAKDDVTDGPAVLECLEDEHELRDGVDDDADHRPNQVYDPQADRLRILEPGELLESGYRDEEAYTEYDEHAPSEELQIK